MTRRASADSTFAPLRRAPLWGSQVKLPVSGPAFEREYSRMFNQLRYRIRLPKDRTGLNTREDFAAIAGVGLWHAFQHFRHEDRYPFEHFALVCMKNAVLDEIRKTEAGVRTIH